MITNHSYGDQNWIDLNSPTKEETDSLVLTKNIDPDIAKDLISPTPNQHVEDRGHIIYTILHIPTFKRSKSICDAQEVDIIISHNGIITGRYDSIDALHFFAKQIEVNQALDKKDERHIFFGMMTEIYNMMENELAFMEDQISTIEKKIFEGREKEMVFAISNAGRNILNFKKTSAPHGDIFEFLRQIGSEKFGLKFGEQAKELIEHWKHLERMVNNQIDLISQLRETNNSMLSTKQNEIMKQLAAIGSVLLPLTLIGQIFGLSIKFFPFKDEPNAFWLILAIMAGVMLVSISIAKIKKWM